MKKVLGIVFTIVLMLTFVASPLMTGVEASTSSGEIPEGFSEGTRPEPELLSQEILDAFDGGMSIEDFLIRNQGPIPNALMDYADTPVTVVVQLDKPSLIEYVNQQGLTRDSNPADQQGYVAELESEQAAVLGQISAGREADVQQIGASFTKVLNGFMLNLPANMVNEIRAIPGVKSVSRAPEYKINLESSVPLIGASDVWADYSDTGEGVTIAVIDTGIDYTHAMFGGSGIAADYELNDPAIVEEGSFPTAKVIGGYDFAGTDYDAGDDVNYIPVPDDDPLDEGGHGTHVASTAAGIDIGFGSGVAPGASLYALKIFGAEGSTNLTLQAIEWAMDPLGLGHLGEPVDVINMSLGADWGPADENDPEFIAVENATSIGVVVVASAGNGGDSSYIVGSPSTADSAISVASSSTGYSTSPYLTFYETNFMPYTTSTNPFTSTITAELVDVAADIDATGLLCTVPAGMEDALLGKIALISRGDCAFTDKINNAETLGAIAAVIYNNEDGTISMDATGSTLPAGSILQTHGATLVGLAPIEISIGPDSEVATFVSSDPPDTIADSSSRGPRGFDSKLKPEITAPGVSIFAAAMGSGNEGISYSGTSMAAPHIAGVAALLVAAHPGWSPVQIKAAMMNTAADLARSSYLNIPRQGAGRVDALAAVETDVVAYADQKLVSLSWGLIELNEDFQETKTVTLRNFSDSAKTFDVSLYFGSGSYHEGAYFNRSAPTVTVPAYGVASVDITLVLIADELSHSFGTLEEYYGMLAFTDGDEQLRIPFYFVPRPYGELTETDSVTEFDANSGMGTVDFAQTGPIESELWAYPVTLVSSNDPDVLDGGDLRYVGMDYGWYSDDYGDIFVPAFAMWGDVHTNQPYFNEVDMYIYSPYGTVVDFNYNYGAMTGGDDTNEWMVAQVDFSDGMLYLASPYSIYADFNSGFQEWYLPAGFQYVLDEFDYEVISYDWNGNSDYAGAASFDISRLPLSIGYLDQFPHNSDSGIGFWVDDRAGFAFADIQGVMLVDYNGKPGAGQSYYWGIKIFQNLFVPIFLN